MGESQEHVPNGSTHRLIPPTTPRPELKQGQAQDPGPCARDVDAPNPSNFLSLKSANSAWDAKQASLPAQGSDINKVIGGYPMPLRALPFHSTRIPLTASPTELKQPRISVPLTGDVPQAGGGGVGG